MRRFLRLSALFTGLMVALPMLASAQEPTKNGVLLPFTGLLAKNGIENWEAMQIARDMINERGGINGRKVEYVQGDATTPNPPVKMRSIVVNELHVTNWERYKDYQEQVPATLALFDGQYVSRGAPEPILGDAPSPRVVVLEFPSRERALAWFHSPEFQRILAIRNEASTSRVYFLEGQ